MKRNLHSIHTRLFLLFLFCMLSLLLVVSALYYKRTTDQLHQKIGEIAQKNSMQTIDLFDLLLRGYDSLTKSINGNPDLQRLLAEPLSSDSALRMINERTIVNGLGAIFYSREDIVGIHVMSGTGAIYSYGNSMSVIAPNYRESDWYTQLSYSTGEMVWLGVKPTSLVDQAEKRPVFAFGRQLYDLHEHRPIGLVIVEVDPKPIVSGLANLSLSPRSEVFIAGGEGRLIASNTESPSAASAWTGLSGAALAEREVRVEQANGQLVVVSHPVMADWQVVSVTPDADLNVEQNQMKRFLLLVISVLVVVSTLLATFVSRTLSSPLKRLIHQMKQVELGNFRGQLHVRSYAEINILVASFNQMVRRMDELIERIKAASISEKNAQLLALQSQVNPHFLYNTLDMIYWMLDEKGNDRLGNVVLALSNMFRYSSRWEQAAEVTLREELEQVGHYLTILQARLDGRLTVEMAVDSCWDDIPLPKMTLQPLIENAVKHGLEPLNRPGALRVSAEASDGLLRLAIADNGRGIAPEALAALRRELTRGEIKPAAASGGPARGAGRSGPAPRGAGIGLCNVHRRLRLLLGEAYGLELESRTDGGTTVIVTLPLPAAKAATALREERGAG